MKGKNLIWKAIGGLLVASAAKEMASALDVAVHGADSETAKQVDGFFSNLKAGRRKKTVETDEVIDVDSIDVDDLNG